MSTPVRLAILALVLMGLGVLSAIYVSYDSDPLNLLPADVPEVEGLRLYQKHFGTDVDLILTIEGDDPELVESAARGLAEHLLSSEGLVKRADWQPPGMDDLSVYGDLIAYAWLNGPPQHFEALAARLSPGQSGQMLANAVDILATGIDAEEMFRAGQDPLGLTEFDTDRLTLRGNANGQFSFASPEGTMRLVFIDAPGVLYDYKETVPWLARMSERVEQWQDNGSHEAESCRIDHTGRAPYIAEVATDLQREMYLSLAITLAVIVSLFWLVHRRLLPLLFLVVCLALTFVVTLSIGGLVYGELGASSAGFAAILIGLVVDYAFILYQESRIEPDPRRLRRKMFHSIAWASATTAAVFFGMNLSLLPGPNQIGTIVAVGIIAGACIMMGVFVWLNGLLKPTPHADPPKQERPARPPAVKGAFICTAMVAVLTTSIFLTRGAPGISASADALRPKESHALDVFAEILRRFDDNDEEKLRIIVSGSTDAEVFSLMEKIEAELAGDVQTPAGLIPHAEFQNANRGTATDLAGEFARLREEADRAGLTADSLALANQVFRTWADLGGTPFYPTSESSRWLLDKMIARDSQPVCALGTVILAPGTTREEENEILDSIRAIGGNPAGWEHLRPAILRLINREYRWVLLPVTGILFVMLLLAFRRIRAVALSIATIGFSTACLLALMSAAGIEWNLINLAGIPLILGAGLDYSIHMQLALQRLDGDLHAVRRSTGKALLLCGASTATGFATLAGSSNAGVESMGLVCASGLAITVLTAVFLLPKWWVAVASTPHSDGG